MLVELNVVEQRSKAVYEVLDGGSATDVAKRYGVARQTVHDWLNKYSNRGIGALADRSSKPQSCPHQMAPAVEAQILEMRRKHPGWGPLTILYELERAGVSPLPGRSSVHRCLVRHGLVIPTKRKRKKEDYKRWERSKAMELWQMDIVGRFHLRDGTEVSVVTGIDDHSRYCVCARIVARATARPVCEALRHALVVHGIPHEVLTDNGKVFTARFGLGPGPVLFDRICHENGVRHILTAPYSPTTTGKVERFHKTLRAGFLTPNDCVFETIAEAQAGLDSWVAGYNNERPHQSVGGRPPAERFALARPESQDVAEPGDERREPSTTAPQRPPGISRWVDQRGQIGLNGFKYRVGPTYAGEAVEVVCQRGLVEILHRGVLVATHAERRRDNDKAPKVSALRQLSAKRPSSGMAVMRSVDAGGSISFAGTMYRVGRSHARQMVEVAIVASSVQISKNGKVIRVHPIRHDRAKEYGAFSTPNGRPRNRSKAAG
jgi:transposase InsO family protein